jgi:hypothetical protein
MHPTPPLRLLLAAVRRRWFAHVALRTIGRAGLAASLPLLAAATVTRLLSLGDGALTALVSAACAAAVGFAAFILWRTERSASDGQVARFIEERVATLPDVPPFDDALVSAVGEGDGGAEAASERGMFRGLVVEAAARRLSQVEPSRIVTTGALGRAAAEAAGGIALLVLAVVLAWPSLARALETAWTALLPRAIQVEVVPGDTRVPAGEPLKIRAIVRTGRNVLSRFTPELTVTSGTEKRVVPMTPENDGYQFSFESVDRTFQYRVVAGSARSRDYTVTALFAPRVQRIDLHYQYPTFTGLSPRDEQDSGDIYAPAGTRVRVRIHTDKPIESGELVFGRGPWAGDRGPVGDRGPGAGEPGTGSQPGVDQRHGFRDPAPGPRPPTLSLQPTASQLLEAELVLARDDSYRIKLADRDGLGSSGDTEYFIRVMDDRPPDVRIVRPAGDQQITPLEEVAIEARADDDYGISRFDLVYSVAGRPPKTVPFSRVTSSDEASIGAFVLAVEDLQVQPGDVITYYARARDVARGKQPTETRSDMFFLEVRPFSEEFVAAQSQAMAGMAGEQIDGLIAAQKEIINATWNIERRSTAGRSADDIKAIGDAQAELRARAEQMISRGGRGRMFPPPQQVAPSRQPRGGRSAGDPVSTAIAAMGRALEQLQGQRTSEALPHEMAALQGLLQAQAEIRRREVMQQRAGAGGSGLGRQGQDLSALFDKELQRQQGTNYESRSNIAERPEQRTEDSALDRIRDLARRQEELSRRQRELAEAGLSAEELKRQLERLTREQAELREQLEELSRQGQQQTPQQSKPPQGSQATKPQAGQTQTGQQNEQGSGAGQSTSPSQPASPSGTEMGEAADQMRRAMSELQRQDPRAAAERAERAAEQLRQLEQQMRADSPEARQRAAGELRLEAQQIADEQRRIAAEAERLQKGGSANADAWRRLAGEKDNLADRVEELQRTAGQLASADKRDPRKTADSTDKTTGVAAAARELERQQIGRRMRETAKEMRETAVESSKPSPSPRGSTPPSRAAEGEQQIARALDRVLDQLGGAAQDAQSVSKELGATRGIQERLDRLEREIREAETKDKNGRSGRGGSTGAGQSAELQRLRDEYKKELQRARETLSRLDRSAPRAGQGGTTPEEHEWSVVDQGTEAFKQDFSRWESLRKALDQAIERYEASVFAKAAKKGLQDRLSAGGSDRVPDEYRRRVARYYESLAKKRP